MAMNISYTTGVENNNNTSYWHVNDSNYTLGYTSPQNISWHYKDPELDPNALLTDAQKRGWIPLYLDEQFEEILSEGEIHVNGEILKCVKTKTGAFLLVKKF